MSAIFRVSQQLNNYLKVGKIAAGVIDLGYFFKCVPYRRVAQEHVMSSPLNLKIHSWCLYLVLTGLVWIHMLAQWISFLLYVSENGVDARACLHLNFQAIYNLSVLFSLQIVRDPESMPQVQNEIEGMQRNFNAL